MAKQKNENKVDDTTLQPIGVLEDLVIPSNENQVELKVRSKGDVKLNSDLNVVEVDNIMYSRVRTVKVPKRGTSHSAGIDLFVPWFDEKFVKDLLAKNEDLVDVKSIYSEAILRNAFSKNPLLFDGDEQGDGKKKIVLRPGTSVNIPSGIHFKLPENTALIAFNKSGVASKKRVTKLAELIDEDYQGEVHINIVNVGKDDVTIVPDEKIIQLALIPVLYSQPKEVDYKNLYVKQTVRGAKGFGEATGND